MKSWPHAPSRLVHSPGDYIITASTYHKQPILNTPEKLDATCSVLLQTLDDLGWELYAWAVMANHYHFVGKCPDSGLDLTNLRNRIHRASAILLNDMDGTPGRRVWFNGWDTQITSQKSLYARIAYVQSNPEKHGVTERATDYRWCSARWFETLADNTLRNTVLEFPTDRVRVLDDF